MRHAGLHSQSYRKAFSRWLWLLPAFIVSGCLFSIEPTYEGFPCNPDNTCGHDLVCIDGICVLDPCPDVVCGEDEVCVHGTCHTRDCFDRECPDGFVCMDGDCVSLDCAHVSCEPGYACANGSCYPTACADIDCGAGVCIDGECVDVSCMDISCPDGEICRDGICVAPTTCDPGFGEHWSHPGECHEELWVPCDATSVEPPPNASIDDEELVPITWSDDEGWSEPVACSWSCDPGYIEDASDPDLCREVDEDEVFRVLTVSAEEGGSTSPAAGMHSFEHGETVTVTATPGTGYDFHGWSGDCSGTGTCQLVMTSDKTAHASFDVITHDLSISSTTGGVTSPAEGTHTYQYGDSIIVTASPDAGYELTGWSGDCSGTGSCQVSMTSDRSVHATFAERSYNLTISSGSGGYTSPAEGTYQYQYGDSITISAIPNSGYRFSGWSGDCSGTGNCNLSMTSDRSVHASFSMITYTLTITVDDGGTTNPSEGVYHYSPGESVTITASSSSSSYDFEGWTGDCSGTGSCNVSMTRDRSVHAIFCAWFQLDRPECP